MRIALLGSTGGVGRHVLEQALARGHFVRALARDPGRLATKHDHLDVLAGDVRDGSIVDPLLAGCDAVVSALGVSRATPGVRPSDGLRALLEGMRRHNVRRYVGISGAALDLPGDRRPLGDRIISAIVRRLIAGVIADKRQELEVLGAASDIVWTLARPPRIVAGSVGEARSSLVTAPGMKIGQADVAAFLLDQLDDEQFAFKAPFIAS